MTRRFLQTRPVKAVAPSALGNRAQNVRRNIDALGIEHQTLYQQSLANFQQALKEDTEISSEFYQGASKALEYLTKHTLPPTTLVTALLAQAKSTNHLAISRDLLFAQRHWWRPPSAIHSKLFLQSCIRIWNMDRDQPDAFASPAGLVEFIESTISTKRNYSVILDGRILGTVLAEILERVAAIPATANSEANICDWYLVGVQLIHLAEIYSVKLVCTERAKEALRYFSQFPVTLELLSSQMSKDNNKEATFGQIHWECWTNALLDCIENCKDSIPAEIWTKYLREHGRRQTGPLADLIQSNLPNVL